MKFKQLFTLATLALFSAPLFAETFQVDGLYYETVSPATEPTVRVVKPAGGEYSGAVEVVPYVTYGGTRYKVDSTNLFSLFQSSEITDFTLGEGWFGDGTPPYTNIIMYNDFDLDKITLKSFYTLGGATHWMATANGANAVALNVRHNSDDDNEVEIVNFNVYGPDGKKLEPFLIEESSMYDGNPVKIYPDENNIFHLGKDFYSPDGNYCMVLPMTQSLVVYLFVEYEGKYMCIRNQPLNYQTGTYVRGSSVDLALENDHFVVIPPLSGSPLYTGEVVIPSHAEYDGQEYPVTIIGNCAFYDSKNVTSITIPETIERICQFAVNDEATSTHIYVKSKTPPTAVYTAFGYGSEYNQTLHVPRGTLATYQTAPEWSKFVNIVDDVIEDDFVFEVDGLYYETMNRMSEPMVQIVKPIDGEYTGAVEVVPYVTYNGIRYKVSDAGIFRVFQNSTITDFTLGEGWFTDETPLTDHISMYNNYELEKVTIKSFYNEGPIIRWIITDNGEKGVYLNVRHTSDEDTEVEVVNFNVYGPDGKKLKPFLVEEASFWSGNPVKIYPDENNIFHLDKNFRNKKEPYGEHCQVLSVAQYVVVCLMVEYEGKYMCVRSQPLNYQTGSYAKANDVNLALANGHFAVIPPKHGEPLYTGDIVIPSEAEFEGRTYPVKVIGNLAFDASHDVTSVTIPATVDSICVYAFDTRYELKNVYCKAKTPPSASGAFYSTTSEITNTMLHVPYGARAAYKADREWSKFQYIYEDVILEEYVFEVDGLRYLITDESPESPTVRLVKPAEGEYTGAVELMPYVTYNNVRYKIDSSSLYSVFQYSTITDFTLGEGWFTDETPSLGNLSMYGNYDLEKVTIKSFYEPSTNINWVNTDNGDNGVYLNVRRISDDDNEVEVVNFNVYGPDGKKLEPFLVEESSFYNGNPVKIYPDKNNVFHLGQNFFSKNGEYCQVLPVGQYVVVCLMVEYEGKYMCIRSQPRNYQTGSYTKANGVNLALANDHFAVIPPKHGEPLYRGDVVIPAQAEFEGRTYPVKVIGNLAFDASRDVTSVTIPATVDSICVYAFDMRYGLKNVYCKATTPPGCTNLSFYTTGNEVNATLHLPYGTFETYQADREWSKFVNIIEDITNQDLVLSHSEINIAADEVFQLGYALAEGKVTWSTSDRNVAYANECGLVVAMGMTGTTIITATVGDMKAECVVNVTGLSRKSRIRALTDNDDPAIEPINIIIESIGGNPPMVNARLIPVGSSTVMNWTSSDESVMIVENGLVTLVGDGEATIGVETDNGLTSAAETTAEDVRSTGVEDIVDDLPVVVTDNNVYDLSGRCVLRNADSDALRQLRPGFYIYGGRKVLVK